MHSIVLPPSWRPDMPTARTRLLVLLGDPVGHSLSPPMQNAALSALQLDAVYLALRADADDLPGLLRGIARAGGGGNITLPHKEIAARTVEVPTGAVLRTGACNTFWLEEGRIHGDNTDVAGFRGAARSLVGRPLEGARALVVGAGGAARGAITGLEEEGAGAVFVWNRTPEKARALIGSMGFPRLREVDRLEPALREDWDLVVHATSLGLRDSDPLPFEPELLRAGTPCLDLVYRPDETPLVHRARGLGLRAADGGEMLVLQGAAAFERWWGRPAPVGVMREAFEAARRGSRNGGSG